MNCPHCGSEHIETGVVIGQSGNGGCVGPKFGAGFVIGIASTAQLYCDICLDCGEITRLYIKSYNHKQWIKKSL